MEKSSLKTLLNSNLFHGCSEKDIEELLLIFRAKEKKFEKGQYILKAGDKTDAMGMLVSGHALILQEDWWGNRNIISEIDTPSSFGESFACVKNSTLTVSVRAETESLVIFLDMERFLKMTGHPAHEKVLQNFISDLSKKNMRFSEKLRHLGGRSTRAKLLSYLSAEAERHHANSFSIPFSRQELADYLFVERSGLSSELSKMQKEGLITTEKNRFTLHRT